MVEKQTDPERKAKPLGKALTVLGRQDVSAGITFGLVIVLFTLGGWWLDTRLETLPTFLLVGFGLGAVGGFIHLVETVSPGTLFT